MFSTRKASTLRSAPSSVRCFESARNGRGKIDVPRRGFELVRQFEWEFHPRARNLSPSKFARRSLEVRNALRAWINFGREFANFHFGT